MKTPISWKQIIASVSLVTLALGCAGVKTQPDPAAEAATEFLQACSQQNWDKASQLHLGAVSASLKEGYGGVEVLQVRKSYVRPAKYDGRFVPCKVRLADGKVLKRKLALKTDAAGKWLVDGGL